MADDLENSSVEALVSLKEGKGNSFHSHITGSPRRGYPARIRKPNRLIFGDEEDEKPSSAARPRKQVKMTTISKVSLAAPDKKVAQTIGVSLRNLLKLPKAHKWVCYEWFYSNIDMALFEGENDFCICLQESFPQLKARKMTRIQWCKVRRLMGKPRRCSSAFFAEERDSLKSKRQKIRQLQQRKYTDSSDFKDLPTEIPMPLVIGTKITARLRRPQDGLFTGVIDALDTFTDTYRVTFDRPGLGTHSIPDIEVLSNEPQETMPLSAFHARHRPRLNVMSPPRFLLPQLTSEQLDDDPLLGASALAKGKMDSGTYGGFPIKFLVLVTRLSKILMVKKERIRELKEMNTDAEKSKSYDKALSVDFQQRYARIILELEQLNHDLNDYLIGVQQFCHKIAPEQGIPVISEPSELSRRCENEAMGILHRLNTQDNGRKTVKKERSLTLISKLTSIMLQIKSFAENDVNSFELKSLQDTLDDIKLSLDPNNLSFFQNNVEIHVKHIQSGLSQMGNLSAFSTASLHF